VLAEWRTFDIQNNSLIMGLSEGKT